jgi:hypothetical protein
MFGGAFDQLGEERNQVRAFDQDFFEAGAPSSAFRHFGFFSGETVAGLSEFRCVYGTEVLTHDVTEPPIGVALRGFDENTSAFEGQARRRKHLHGRKIPSLGVG